MKNIEKIMLQALESITKVNEASPVKTYQRMEEIAQEALNKVSKGGINHARNR